MNMRRWLAAGCALLAGSLQAQAPTEAQGHVPGGPMRHDIVFVAGAQLEQERVIEGAPYCADAVHESVQVLADGNRIVQRQVSRQCRDGQGRTRQELTTAGGRSHVYVRDPVAGESWMLEPERKLALRIGAPRQPLAAAEPRIWDRFAEWGQHLRDKIRLRPAVEPAPVPAPGPFPVVAPLPFPPEPVAFTPRLPGRRGPGTTTLLPGESMEGLRADGKRTVWTIEAGRIGNEKPITIINEVWSSPELGITLKTRDVDPVGGEHSFRVHNIVRGEPDPQLFRVPAEFAKVSPPGPIIRIKP